ncbi:MAG: hypothetical protein KTR16_07640 [Acidiferrobacterales bacterium]|nr:hypothetical protein [Acidiferrobacterales bacterium]
MNQNKVILFITVSLMLVFPQLSFADSSGPHLSQLVHNISHAHHAYGGLMFLAVIVIAFRLKKKRKAERVRDKS